MLALLAPTASSGFRTRDIFPAAPLRRTAAHSRTFSSASGHPELPTPPCDRTHLGSGGKDTKINSKITPPPRSTFGTLPRFADGAVGTSRNGLHSVASRQTPRRTMEFYSLSGSTSLVPQRTVLHARHELQLPPVVLSTTARRGVVRPPQVLKLDEQCTGYDASSDDGSSSDECLTTRLVDVAKDPPVRPRSQPQPESPKDATASLPAAPRPASQPQRESPQRPSQPRAEPQYMSASQFIEEIEFAPSPPPQLLQPPKAPPTPTPEMPPSPAVPSPPSQPRDLPQHESLLVAPPPLHRPRRSPLHAHTPSSSMQIVLTARHLQLIQGSSMAPNHDPNLEERAECKRPPQGPSALDGIGFIAAQRPLLPSASPIVGAAAPDPPTSLAALADSAPSRLDEAKSSLLELDHLPDDESLAVLWSKSMRAYEARKWKQRVGKMRLAAVRAAPS